MDKQIQIKYVIGIAALCLILGFFTGQEYIKYRISNAFKEVSESLDSTFPASDTESNVEDDTNYIEVSKGDLIELATIDLVVNSSEEKKTMAVDYGNPIVPSEGAKLIKVNMTVTNTTDSEFSLGSDWTFVMNQDEKRFTEHESVWELEDYIGYENLKPEISKTGSLLFEVSESSEVLYLILGKAGSNDVYKVALNN